MSDITLQHLQKIADIEKALAQQTESNLLLHRRLEDAELQKNKAQQKLLMYIAFAGTLSLVLNIFKPKIKIVRYDDVKNDLK